jgi:hypothetical protein
MLASASLAGAQAPVQEAAAARRPPAKNTNRDVIARSDLDAKPSANLYDVVSSLRSHWLRGSATARQSMSVEPGVFARAGQSGKRAVINDPNMATASGVTIAVVYVDGRAFGAIPSLRTMPAEAAEKICYYTVNRAQGKFGLAVESPVIEVFTRSSSYARRDC